MADELTSSLFEEGNTYLELLDKLKDAGAEIADLKARNRELTQHLVESNQKVDATLDIMTRCFNELNWHVFNA